MYQTFREQFLLNCLSVIFQGWGIGNGAKLHLHKRDVKLPQKLVFPIRICRKAKESMLQSRLNKNVIHIVWNKSAHFKGDGWQTGISSSSPSKSPISTAICRCFCALKGLYTSLMFNSKLGRNIK